MQPLSKFKHINATSIEEATSTLSEYGGKAAVIAGGTDLVGLLKFSVLSEYPEALVNIKTIPNLEYIEDTGGILKIGALAKLKAIAGDSTVKAKYPAVAEAADSVGSPQLRVMGTIGGNLCQETRCWYLRAPRNRYFCFRKGGTLCFATIGDNRFNAILGGQVCFAVCPSDTAIALTALDASIVTNKRTIPIGDLYKVLGNNLEEDEFITEIQVPEPSPDTKQTFLKFRIRKAIDFAIASAAISITGASGSITDARVVMGGVAPIPYRSTGAEDALKGNTLSESVADDAAEAAVQGSFALSDNAYKIQIAKTLVKRAVMS